MARSTAKARALGRRLGSWIRRGLVGLVVVVFVLAASGASYQAIGTRLDERAYPPPARWSTWAATGCTSTALVVAVRP